MIRILQEKVLSVDYAPKMSMQSCADDDLCEADTMKFASLCRSLVFTTNKAEPSEISKNSP